MNDPRFSELLSAEQALIRDEIAKGIAGLEVQSQSKFDVLKQVADERDKTLETRRQSLLSILGLVTLVIGVLGAFGVKQIWNVNDRLRDVEAAKKSLSEQIENSKREMSEVSQKSDRINHTVARYLITQWVEDFGNIMTYLSATMPKDDREKATITLKHNLDLIASLKAAYAQQRKLEPVSDTGTHPLPQSANEDDRAVILLHKAYQALLSAVNLSSVPRSSTGYDHVRLLNEAETAWREWALKANDENEKIIPHLHAYAINIEAVIIHRRHDAFNTGEEQLEQAMKLYAKAGDLYSEFSKAFSNEGAIYADRFDEHLAQAVKTHTVVEKKEALLVVLQAAIDLTNKARAVATHDRTASLLENNLATYYYAKAGLLHLCGDKNGAEEAIKQADKNIDDALNHEIPSPYAYITGAEIKGQHLLINSAWRDENCRTEEAQWDAIIRLIRTACKKHWPHEKRAEDVCEKCPGLKGLEVLHRKSWLADLQAVLDNP